MDENLRAILNREKLEHILDLFLEQGVTDSISRDFTDSDLRELGVNKIGERMRLLSAFKFDSTFPSLHSFVQPSDSSDTTATQGSMINVKGGILPADSPVKAKNVSDFEIAKHTLMRTCVLFLFVASVFQIIGQNGLDFEWPGPCNKTNPIRRPSSALPPGSEPSQPASWYLPELARQLGPLSNPVALRNRRSLS